MHDAALTAACDAVLPFQVDRLGVRGRMVRLCDAAAPLMIEGRYPDAVRALALDTLALTALLASTLKYEGVFSLQIQGDGPISLLVADATSEGELRAYAKYNAEALDEIGAAAGDPPAKLIGTGHMAFTVDQGPDTERYQGITELAGATLAECASAYFRQSEQLDTAIIGARVKTQGPGRVAAAALLVQRLPAKEHDEDEASEAWREAAVLAGTASEAELLDAAVAPEELLYRLYHESGIRTFEPQPLRFACRCSRDRVSRTLASFPKDEIETFRVDGEVVVTCEFCGTEYAFDDPALEAVFTLSATA
jgi:molecular chaperone Hsp33